MKDKWTQQFQGKLDGYEMAAPEMEWTELDNALADNAIADNAPAKNKRSFMTLVWGRRLVAAAAVALMVIGGARVLLPELEGGKEEAPEQNSGDGRFFRGYGLIGKPDQKRLQSPAAGAHL